MGTMLPMATPSLLELRTNDDTKLFDAARKGLPTLYIYRTADKTLETVREEFGALQVHMIQGGSHSPFADGHVSEVAEAIRRFSEKGFSA